MTSSSQEITQWFLACSDGNQNALDRLIPLRVRREADGGAGGERIELRGGRGCPRIPVQLRTRLDRPAPYAVMADSGI